jgi:hypothetical protein
MPGAIEMPQAQLIFYAGVARPAARIGGRGTTGTSPAGGGQYSTRRGKDIPENTRPEPVARRKAVDHLRVLRVLIGIS